MGATAGGGVGAAVAMLGAAAVVGVAGAMLGAAAVVGVFAGAALGAVAVDGIAAGGGVAGAAAGGAVTGVGDAGAGPPLQPATSAAAKSANPVVYIARIRFAISVLPISATGRRLAEWLPPILCVRTWSAGRDGGSVRRNAAICARYNLLHISDRIAPIISNAPRL